MHVHTNAGVLLSRSEAIYFKHNDMQDLERILKQCAADDVRLKRKPESRRRFIVVEGLYRHSGHICPLPELMALKSKYFHRLIVEESFSIGVLGATGKGVTEYFNLPNDAIDIMCAALCNSLASVGGFCVGSQEVVDHQRLAGSGYCFSASAPPFVSVVAVKALDILQAEPQLLQQLLKNTKLVLAGVSKIDALQVRYIFFALGAVVLNLGCCFPSGNQ